LRIRFVVAYTSRMPSAKTRATIDHEIEIAVAELEPAISNRRANLFVVKMAGGVAALVGRHDLFTRLEVAISHLTDRDLLRGAITNIDVSTLDTPRRLRLPTLEEMARNHPLCDDDFLIGQIKAQDDPWIQLCLQGEMDAAVRVAESSLALDDIACTLAATNQFDRATAFIDAQSVTDNVKAHVRFVILLETCRRQLPGFAEAILQARRQDYERLHVVLALAGRLPWIGYPYPDW
jgi:hypothetical protein